MRYLVAAEIIIGRTEDDLATQQSQHDKLNYIPGSPHYNGHNGTL